MMLAGGGKAAKWSSQESKYMHGIDVKGKIEELMAVKLRVLFVLSARIQQHFPAICQLPETVASLAPGRAGRGLISEYLLQISGKH